MDMQLLSTQTKGFLSHTQESSLFYLLMFQLFEQGKEMSHMLY